MGWWLGRTASTTWTCCATVACRVCPAACARFKRLITAHGLHLFVAPTRDEAAWAAERMDSDGHQLALLLALKPYQRMGRPKPDEYPEVVVDFVRRTVELPQGTLPSYATGRTAERQRTEVRQRVGTKYQQARARQIAEAAIRKEAAAKNRPADLIKIALEKVVAAGLELPAFSTFDTMTSTIRTEVNASICRGIHDRMSAAQRAGRRGCGCATTWRRCSASGSPGRSRRPRRSWRRSGSPSGRSSRP
ncbi:DUF4158 domain-containing protein [Streptomyces sp. NPDC057729]|uniref:DUF4158 domain-containing protein n=1 Tax=Streptomyces sp. NPDC057729 TaxID=3346230 RepID=UPI003697E74A